MFINSQFLRISKEEYGEITQLLSPMVIKPNLPNDWIYGLADTDYGPEAKEIVKEIDELAKGNFPFLTKMVSSYFSGYTYGMSCGRHRDTPQNTMILMVYLVPYWTLEMEGFTYIFTDKNKNMAKAVIPSSGRCIVFSSDFEHMAGGVSRQCELMKITFTARYIYDKEKYVQATKR